MNSSRLGALAALLCLAAAGAAKADPNPYPNAGVYNATAYSFTASSNGDLVAYFVGGSRAGYDNQLGVLVNGVAQGGYGLENHGSSYGDSYDFGAVSAGDVLTFVLDNLSLSKLAYSDPSLNAAYDDPSYDEGHNHIYSNNYAGDATVPAGVYVAFEDLPFPRSDFNYDDESFVFTIVAAAPIAAAPEPGLWGLMMGGFGLVGGLMRWSRALRRESATAGT